MSDTRSKELAQEMHDVRKKWQTLVDEKKEIDEQKKFETELEQWKEYTFSVWKNAAFKEDLNPEEILASSDKSYGMSAYGLPAMAIDYGQGSTGNLVARSEEEALKMSFIDTMIDLTERLKYGEKEKRDARDVDEVFAAYLASITSFFESDLFSGTEVQNVLQRQIEKIILEMQSDEDKQT